MVSITFKVYRRERVIPIQTWHSDAIMSPVGFSLFYGRIDVKGKIIRVTFHIAVISFYQRYVTSNCVG